MIPSVDINANQEESAINPDGARITGRGIVERPQWVVLQSKIALLITAESARPTRVRSPAISDPL
jgi:hypothetical protein